jgi:glycerol-3-phosphate O-acyltransferase
VDDEFSRPRRIAQFLSGLLKLNSRIYVTFGTPLDPFGNRVDFQGRSIDSHGRPIGIEGYLQSNGELTVDTQRDREYTNVLAQSITREFENKNCLQSTHFLAFSAFQLMRRQNPHMDIYRLLRSGSGPAGFATDDLVAGLGRLLERVKEMRDDGEIALDPRLDGKTPQQVLERGLRHFNAYHTRKAIRREGSRIQVDDSELVYYYHNRMAGYGLESLF